MSGQAQVPERVTIRPNGLGGALRVPGDKSISHRALIIGALADAAVAVDGLADSADVAATAAALRALGIRTELARRGDGRVGGTVQGPPREPESVLDCGNSGTSLRLLAGVAAGVEGLTVLTGDASLRGRPVDRVRVPLEAMGALVQARAGGRLPPLVVRGGRLAGVDHRSEVASAQVKSAVLLAGLGADGPSTVTTPLPCRDHTERLLRHLGVEVATEQAGARGERVTVRPSRVSARPLTVPGDPSSAAVWLVAAACAGAPLRVEGVCVNPTRLGAVDVLRAMGADVEIAGVEQRCGEPVGSVQLGPGRALQGAEVRGRTVVDAIDELPLLAVAGAVSRDGVEVRDAAELRVKESDRISAVAGLFAALGLTLEERPDGFRVAGGQRPAAGRVDARGDHRIAMAAAVAATVATGPVEITGFGAVATSYPAFLEDLRRLGGQVELPVDRA